ncbi:MAG: hypothetical protein AAF958_08365 [Planctomycetota bacterium]
MKLVTILRSLGPAKTLIQNAKTLIQNETTLIQNEKTLIQNAMPGVHGIQVRHKGGVMTTCRSDAGMNLDSRRWLLVWICVLATALGSAASVTADESDTAVQSGTDNTDASTEGLSISEDDVLDLLDELDGSSLASRKKAEKRLIEAGPDVLRFLPKNDPNLSAEATGRIERIREALQKQVSRAEARTEAVVVRLSGVTTLDEALEAISRDSGIEFEYSADASSPITPIAAPLSFWHAVDLVLDQAKLDINFYGGDRETLSLVQREAERPSRVDSAAYTGVYRLEPLSVTATRSLQSPSQSSLNVTMQIAWQPGLTPIGLTIPTQNLIGRMDDGQILKPQVDGGSIEVVASADLASSEFYVPMQLPAGTPEKISAISGVLRATLPGPVKTFELPVVGGERSKKLGAMTVEIEDVRPAGDLQAIRLLVQLDDASDALESHRQWIFENEIYIRDAEGKRLDQLGYEVYRQSPDSAGVAYLFSLEDDLNQYKVFYRSPTSVQPNEVAFVIQDIDLP